ncbi:MAG: SpoVG family protein [Clostridia bacterium]|nr:SpoVG family protein [Clostridia bacterium]
MLVTSFRLKKIENPTNRLVAKCTLTFDAMLAVSDIKILIKEDGEYYMGMPSRKTAAGTFKDEAYPVNSNVRQALERIIFSAMKQAEQMDGVIFNGEIKQGHGKVSLLQQDIEDFAIETL